jgi:hypothetical protein
VRKHSGIWILGLVASATAHADARIDYTLQGDCTVEPSALQISGSRMRIDHEMAGHPGSSLFDGLEETMVYLDHERRRYREVAVDFDATDYTADVAKSSMNYLDRQMEKVQQQMEENCRQAEKQGTACPQQGAMDIQAMMAMAQGMQAAQPGDGAAGTSAQEMDPETLMQAVQGKARPQNHEGGGTPDLRALQQAQRPPLDAVAVSDSGKDETVAGAICRWFEEHRGSVLLRAQCFADPATLPLPERDLAGMRRALAVLQGFGDAFAPIKQRFAPASESAARPQGIVLSQRCYGQDGALRGSAVATIRQVPVADEALEIPPGYQVEASGEAEQ